MIVSPLLVAQFENLKQLLAGGYQFVAKQYILKPQNYENVKRTSGYITAALMVSAGVATIVLYGLAFLVISQYRILQRQDHSAKSLAIAEAGINYYRWHLAHAPNDFTDGTGEPGPYIHQSSDPQGGVTGYFSLEITPPVEGSSIVTIESTGWTTEMPGITRTITAQYGRQSMAKYAFLHDANIWFGGGLVLNGQAHSNGGIRQDGINHSLVTSALESYNCGNDSGCTPPVQKPAIWGSGSDAGLWQYPVPPVDFNALGVDFAEMRDEAQNNGLYLEPSANWGYHIVFQLNGTVDVYKITNLRRAPGYNVGQGCQPLYQIINRENLIGSYQQSDTPIVFAEDHVWIEGTITSPLSVVVARFPLDSNLMNIWITNNVVYSTYDGSVRAGLISQNDIYMALNIPDNIRIDGALLAKGGQIVRQNYGLGACGNHPNAVRNSLTVYGSVISALKSYWNWGTGPTSGFLTRTITYDPNLRYFPPPYFPTTGEYEFISWTE